MFDFVENGHLVTVTYRQPHDRKDPYRAFADGIGDLRSAYRFDFLLDFRLATGPLSILTSPLLSRKWAALARGRDVGRRTAIVCSDRGVIAQVGTFRRLYPYRVIDVFADIADARGWLESVADSDGGEIQYI